jgi:hypothetical protein
LKEQQDIELRVLETELEQKKALFASLEAQVEAKEEQANRKLKTECIVQ